MYDGRRHLGPLIGGIRSCGIVACTTKNRHSCASRSTSLKPASFDSIKIFAKVLIEEDNVFYFPTTVQLSLKPVTNYLYCQEDLNAKEAKIEMETVFDEENILTFGFYGRVYSRDAYVRSSNEKLSGNEWMKIFMVSVAIAIVVSVIFIFYAQRTDFKLKIT